MKSEYAVAATASIAKRYTKTGTVRMLPPPPIKPRAIPINIDAMYPKITII
jgi:hypothetical protein